MNDCTSKIKPAIKMIFCVIIILIYILYIHVYLLPRLYVNCWAILGDFSICDSLSFGSVSVSMTWRATMLHYSTAVTRSALSHGLRLMVHLNFVFMGSYILSFLTVWVHVMSDSLQHLTFCSLGRSVLWSPRPVMCPSTRTKVEIVLCMYKLLYHHAQYVLYIWQSHA